MRFLRDKSKFIGLLAILAAFAFSGSALANGGSGGGTRVEILGNGGSGGGTQFEPAEAEHLELREANGGSGGGTQFEPNGGSGGGTMRVYNADGEFLGTVEVDDVNWY